MQNHDTSTQSLILPLTTIPTPNIKWKCLSIAQGWGNNRWERASWAVMFETSIWLTLKEHLTVRILVKRGESLHETEGSEQPRLSALRVSQAVLAELRPCLRFLPMLWPLLEITSIVSMGHAVGKLLSASFLIPESCHARGFAVICVSFCFFFSLMCRQCCGSFDYCALLFPPSCTSSYHLNPKSWLSVRKWERFQKTRRRQMSAPQKK